MPEAFLLLPGTEETTTTAFFSKSPTVGCAFGSVGEAKGGQDRAGSSAAALKKRPHSACASSVVLLSETIFLIAFCLGSFGLGFVALALTLALMSGGGDGRAFFLVARRGCRRSGVGESFRFGMFNG